VAFVTVADILNDQERELGLQLVTSNKGLKNKIKIPYVQKPGLAMPGYVSYVAQNRVQVFGKTEMTYLAQLPADELRRVCEKFFAQGVACCIVTRGIAAPNVFLEQAELNGTPILVTSLRTQRLIERLTNLLERFFARRTSLHGVLLDVFGVGILLLGDSGIGKSECALDLIMRNHRLVADDMVDLFRSSSLNVYGRGPEITKYHMEIRGIGILNIKELFGISAIRDQKRVQVIIKLVPWQEDVDYDRLGLEDKTINILDVELPLIVLPVRSGRNLSTIIEVAARNYLLKLEGFYAAREFQDRLLKRLAEDAQLGATKDPE